MEMKYGHRIAVCLYASCEIHQILQIKKLTEIEPNSHGRTKPKRQYYMKGAITKNQLRAQTTNKLSSKILFASQTH